MPANEVDTWVSKLPATLRGIGAIAAFTVSVFAVGFAAGSWGVRQDIDDLRDTQAEARRSRQTIQADVATNRSQIASLQSLVEQADLKQMSENIRRIARELCLMRYDRAGTVTPEQQQECARM